MHCVSSTKWLRGALRIGDALPPVGIPAYLCPLSYSAQQISIKRPNSIYSSGLHAGRQHRRRNHTHAAPIESSIPPVQSTVQQSAKELPLTCSGCGAFSQTTDKQQFGFYDPQARRVKSWLAESKDEAQANHEDELVNSVLGSMDQDKLKEIGLDPASMVYGGKPELSSK